MQTGAELDPVAILRSLGRSEPSCVRQIVGGADAHIWRVEIGGQAFALRVLQPYQAEQARRELAASTAAASAGLPVPAVAATGTWHGYPVQLLAWSPGERLADVLLQNANDLDKVRALGVEFGRVQAAIHAVPVPADINDDPNGWRAWAGSDPELQRCLVALPDQPPVLLHLDYHPLNVLVEDGRISAVLDWANARAGDPRADLARTLSILQLAPLPPGFDVAAARRRPHRVRSGLVDRLRHTQGPVRFAPFCWWAGEVMLRDLSPRLGRPDLPWLTSDYLDLVRNWTATWRARALGSSAP